MHQNECFVHIGDDDPVLVAALKRAGMVFDPMSETGWVWPEEATELADEFDAVAASWSLVAEVGD